VACNDPAGDGVGAQYISWKYCELTHQATQAQHQLSSLFTVYTALLACRRQCQKRPLSVAPNVYAKCRSPQTAGDVTISNYMILNTIRVAARPNALNPLSIVNSNLMKIQAEIMTHFPSLDTLNTSWTRSLNHCHLLCCRQQYTPAPVLHGAITLPSYGNTMLRVAFRISYKSIPTTRVWCVKSTNISSVGSRWRSWRRTTTMCWRKQTPLCVSQVWNTGMVSRSSWVACQIIRISGSGNHTLWRLWDGMTITNTLSNTAVETSSRAWNCLCGSQPTLSIGFTPLSVSLTTICHRSASILKSTLRTFRGSYRSGEIMENNDILIDV